MFFSPCGGAVGPTFLRPGEVCHRNDEEAVGSIGNTGQGVVPGSKGRKDAKRTASTGATGVGSTSSGTKVRDSQHQEGHIESEEEEEEGHGRFQRAEQEDEGEDKPTLEEYVSYGRRRPVTDPRTYHQIEAQEVEK